MWFSWAVHHQLSVLVEAGGNVVYGLLRMIRTLCGKHLSKIQSEKKHHPSEPVNLSRSGHRNGVASSSRVQWHLQDILLLSCWSVFYKGECQVAHLLFSSSGSCGKEPGCLPAYMGQFYVLFVSFHSFMAWKLGAFILKVFWLCESPYFIWED